MLRAAGIAKRYGAVAALAGVDFEVDPGEIVALAGENGSGKSTLARILAGAVSPDAGTVAIDGELCRFSRPREAIDLGVSMVAQELTAVPDLTVAENVLLTRLTHAVSRFSRRQIVVAARQYLDAVGVTCDPLTPFSSLRPGERELVEVAKALATQPRLLILDEATSRLDERDVARVFDLVRRLAIHGTATVLITHRLAEVCELAGRAVVLRDGSVVGELGRDELDEERLSRLMVGRELTDFFHKREVEAGDPMLRVEELVVEGSSEPISFHVRGGEILGLAGLVGSGRSEILETIAGARRACGGRVFVDGVDVRGGSPRAALKAGIAFVPEDRHRQGLVLDASVRENVSMGSWRAVGGARRRRERRTAEEAVRTLHVVTAGVDVPVRTLSGGNQQKVVLGRCLARSPKVFLLDEPTRGIDVGAKEEIFELVGRLLEQGMAILLVSSDLLEIVGISDRVLVLHEQRAVGELSRAEISEERIALLSGGGKESVAA